MIIKCLVRWRPEAATPLGKKIMIRMQAGEEHQLGRREPGICEILYCGLLEDIDLTQTTIEK